MALTASKMHDRGQQVRHESTHVGIEVSGGEVRGRWARKHPLSLAQGVLRRLVRRGAAGRVYWWLSGSAGAPQHRPCLGQITIMGQHELHLRCTNPPAE